MKIDSDMNIFSHTIQCKQSRKPVLSRLVYVEYCYVVKFIPFYIASSN